MTKPSAASCSGPVRGAGRAVAFARGTPTDGWHWLIVLGLGLLATLAYWNSLAAPFLFDDENSIVRNTTIRDLSAIGRVLSPPAEGEGVTGRPIVNLSLALNYAIGGYEVASYHAFNILAHAVTAALLFGLVRRSFLLPVWNGRFAASARAIAWVSAAWWTLHPLQTESVTCVIQRTEVLLGLFYVLTLYGFVRAQTAVYPVRWYGGAVIACLFGMATKEVMVSAPLIVLLFDRALVAGSFAAAWRERRRFYAALAATWVLLFALVWGMGGSRGAAAGFGLGVTWWSYAFKQCEAIVHYLRLAVWPAPLVLDYGTDVVTDFIRVFPQAVLLLAGLGFAWTAFRRNRPIGVVWVAFFAILAPSSSVLPLVTQTMAEHRMYLPTAAVTVSLASLAFVLLGRRALVPLLCVAAACGWLTRQRNELYLDPIAVWADTVAKRPENPRAHTNLGNAHLLAGQALAAIDSYAAALRLKPDFAEAHANLAGALLRLERIDEALEHGRAALALSPGNAIAHNNLAGALTRKGDVRAALEHARAAVLARPEMPEARLNLATALAASGLSAAAIEEYEGVLRQRPDSPDAHFGLGCVFLEAGRWREAEQHLQRAIVARANYAEARDALGSVYLRQGRPRDAIAQYEKAVDARPKFSAAHSNLGLACLQAGEAAAAIRHFETALQGNPENIDALGNLGAALLAVGRVDDAIRRYEQAARLQPQSASALRNLGIAFSRAGRSDAAARHFAAALQLKPDLVEANLDWGVMLLEGADPRGAAEKFAAARQLRPQAPEVRQLLGVALMRAGDREGARAELTAAVQLQPEFSPAQLALGELSMMEGKFAEAVAHFERAVRAAPNDIEALYQLARAQSEIGRVPDAIGNLERALRVAPDAAPVQALLAKLRASKP